MATIAKTAPAKATVSAKAAKNSRFQKGSGMYACRSCDRNTRSTGNGDNEGVQLCEQCYTLAGEENHLADNGCLYAPVAEVRGLFTALEGFGKNPAELFPEVAEHLDAIAGIKPKKGAKAAPAPAVKKATKAAPAPKATPAPAKAGKTAPDASGKLVLLVKTNPKREGSAAHARFQAYFGAKTVEAAIAAGATRKDIAWDVKHGFIEVK